MKKYLVSFLFVLCFGIFTSEASACRCAEPSPQSAFDRSDVVFVGEVVHTDEVLIPNTRITQLKATFSSSIMWKGVISENQIVHTNIPNGGNCGYYFEKGKEYLVYARQGNHISFTDSCSGTKPVSQAVEDLKILGVAPEFPPRTSPYTEHLPFLLSLSGYSFLAFVISFLLIPRFIRLLRKWKIGKNIREESMDGKSASIFRSLHMKKKGTPTMGGVLIWGTVLAVVLFSRFLSLFDIVPQSLLQRGEVYLPLFTLISMGILGAIDDYLNVKGIGKKAGMNALPKLLFTLLFAIISAWWFTVKLGYSSIHIPFLGDFDIGLWYIPLFILVIIATTNAVNFTDGLDGLAGGLLIIAYSVFVAIAYAKGHPFLATFCGVIIGALLSFLWHNIPPAKFFMGDTGSFALGATLGVIAMMIDAVAILPLVGFVFVVEGASSILQILSKKFRNGKKIFLVAPIHHHFEKKGWTEAQVVMRFWIVGGIFAVIGLIAGLITIGGQLFG